MPPKIRSFIKTHFHAAEQNGWLPFFKEAADAHNFEQAYLMAIASRETNMQNIKGDFRGGKYHGFGVMQVDIGTDPEFCSSGAWRDPRKAIMRGTEILASKRAELQRAHAHFKSDHDFQWVLAASYNHGSHGSLGDYILHGSPDPHTTGHDYGADVMTRFREFGELLAARAGVAAQPINLALEDGEEVGREGDEVESAHASSPGGQSHTTASAGEQVEAPNGAAPSTSQPPAKTETPQDVVEVKQSVPAKDVPDDSLAQRAQKTAAQVKAWYVAIPAAVLQFLLAVYKWATDPAHQILVFALLAGVTVIVVVFVVMNFNHSKDKRRAEETAAQRDFELKKQREAQAHELTLLQAKTAASRTENTVRIVPDPLENSDATA